MPARNRFSRCASRPLARGGSLVAALVVLGFGALHLARRAVDVQDAGGRSQEEEQDQEERQGPEQLVQKPADPAADHQAGHQLDADPERISHRTARDVAPLSCPRPLVRLCAQRLEARIEVFERWRGVSLGHRLNGPEIRTKATAEPRTRCAPYGLPLPLSSTKV